MASTRPVLLAILNISARGINTDCIARSHELSYKVETTSTATASLKDGLVLHVIETALLNDCELIQLETVAVELIPELTQESMLHETKSLQIILLHCGITAVDNSQIGIG
jgi:hypothetical protein